MSKNNDDATGWLVILAIIGGIVFAIYKLIEWIVTIAVPFVIILFGWGGILGIIAAVILIWLLRTNTLAWYHLIGGIVLTFALWGVLSLFPGTGLLEGVGLGGRIGQSIIGGYTDITGVLRALGLIISGMSFFVVPYVLEHRRIIQKQEEMRKRAEAERVAKKQAETESKKAELINMIDEALENGKATRR